MIRIRRLNFVLFLSAVMIALPLLLAPANATTPAEIEREKDNYYFRIHGHPSPIVQFGYADVTYKNLSPSTQSVLITFKYYWVSPDPKYGSFPKEVSPGEEISYKYIDQLRIPADLGTLFEFKLYIGTPSSPPDPNNPTNPVSSGTIIIPPP